MSILPVNRAQWLLKRCGTACILFILLGSPFYGLADENGLEMKESAIQEPVHRHLLLVLVPDFSFNELPPFLDRLPDFIHQHLQFAGMSMRTDGGSDLYSNAITLATGNRVHTLSTWNSYQTHFENRRRSEPGWIGETLHTQQVETFAFGNSDRENEIQRIAPLFVMNRMGETRGLVSDRILTVDPQFPTGQKTSWEKLTTEIEQVWRSAPSSLITVELGDLTRIHSQKEQMSSAHYAQVKQGWLGEWGEWLDDLAQRINRLQIEANTSRDGATNGDAAVNEEFSIWIVSPMVSTEARESGKMLAPYLTWYPHQSPGLLSSQTSKQPGIVANVDLAPSILEFFTLEQPYGRLGKVIQTSSPDRSNDLFQNGKRKLFSVHEPQAEGMQAWFNHIDYLFTIYDHRRPIITWYILVVIVFLLGSTVYWWFETRQMGGKLVQTILGAVLVSPLYFLWLTPLINAWSVWAWIVLLWGCSLITSLFLYRLLSHALFLASIGLANSWAILYDLWQGSMWMKRSFLGYDPVIGARYYGLGNEYAGVLLGSSILAVTGLYIWLRRERLDQSASPSKRFLASKWGYFSVSSGFYAVIIYAMAAPHLGTNAGATLASLLTYGCSQWLLFQFRLNKKRLLTMALLLGFVLVAVGTMHLQGEHTHIASALGWIGKGEWQEVGELLSRKWDMNMKLIRASLWGKLFVTTLVVITIILFRLRNNLLVHLKQDAWFQGFQATLVGALLILLVNDSGVVSAATTMIFVAFPFIYLRFNGRDESSSSRAQSSSS